MKISRNIVSAVIISLMIGNTSLSVPSYADDLDDQLSDIQGQIDASRIEQANWEQVIEEVSTRLKGIQAELNAATARLREIQRQQAQINAQIEQTKRDIAKAEAYLKSRQNILNRRVRAIYMHGQLNYLEVILGANSFSDFANRIELLKRIIRSDYNLILEIQKQKAAIEAKKAQLEEDKRQLDALALEAEKARQEIAVKKAEQQKILDSAKSNRAAAAQMEKDLAAQAEQVRNLIQQRLAAAEAARQAASGGGSDDGYIQGTGAMSWPCSGPITSPFGYRTHPIFGTTIFHAGIDIGVDYGTPIHAADSGVVVYSGWISGYGNAVIIDHGGGVSTLYGHNQSLAVSEGQSVSKGSVIAYAGSTGNSTGPHCHFEVDINGSPVNPMGYL
ncbi:murein hydrolase activator EnvC family protein [Dialister sp.]|jgi:murein DD-endopeptidase MepM/ murein hydrolase activator NlpD|uniref:murein hydrolase activator EnvC family protein n=1 Tax=Dialister sp. TaxID=1955814 RepID=UPI002E80043D|nr:peptidoglycan DD-metalloendopeptidase family protein [Dialister sp.]MEE3452010.1 peptidoglycan DD-metalloendopeptidase family protein [Dialister sp.]